jgi:hypothetical protein
MAANTSSTGTASFSRSVSARGTYTVTVVSVTKTNSIYDPAGNTLTSRTVTIR